MMKLYWGSHTCAIGIHVLLEEIGAPYETEKLDLADDATRRPPFVGLNPKRKVPTLVRDDGTVLTEFSAIATWLARIHPDNNLLPSDPEVEARAVETIAYVEGIIHGQGFAHIFAPQLFEPQDLIHQTVGLGQASVKRQGWGIVETGSVILDPQVGEHEYGAGSSFTIAGAELFYVERWAAPQGMTLPVNLAAHLARMLARPAVHKVRQIWGEA